MSRKKKSRLVLPKKNQKTKKKSNHCQPTPQGKKKKAKCPKKAKDK